MNHKEPMLSFPLLLLITIMLTSFLKLVLGTDLFSTQTTMQNQILSSYISPDIISSYESDLRRCCFRCLNANRTDPVNTPCSTFSYCETDGKCIALTKPGYNSSGVPTMAASLGCSVYSWTSVDQQTISRVMSHSATTSFGLLFTPDVNQTYNYTVAFKNCFQQKARILDIGSEAAVVELCSALRVTMSLPVGTKLWIRSYPRAANPCGYDSQENVKHYITITTTNCSFTFDQPLGGVNATALCFYPQPDTHSFQVTANNSVTTNYLAFVGHTMTYTEAQDWCSSQTNGVYGLHKMVTFYYQVGEDLVPVMKPRHDIYPCGMQLWYKQVATNCTYHYIDFTVNDRTMISSNMPNICGVANKFPFCSDRPT